MTYARSARAAGAAEPGVFLRYVIPAYVALATVGVGAVVLAGLAEGLAPGASGGCSFHVGAALAGSAEFFRTHVAPGCADLTVSEARTTLGVDAGFALAYGAASAVLIAWLWPRAWSVRAFLSKRAAAIALPVVTAVLDLVENTLVTVGLGDSGEGLALEQGFAAAAGIAGWWKWTFAVLTVLAVSASVAGALGNLRTPRPRAVAPDAPGSGPRNDTGICLTGAGMSSAGFALGALRALERRGVPARARWVTSAAGGAYAAAAWFVARARGAQSSVLDAPKGEPDLVRYVGEHRRYLGAGRGGRPATVVLGTLLGVTDLLVLSVPVLLVAWPFGRLASSWVVQPDLGDGPVEVATRLWLPGVAGFAAGLVLVVASLFLWDPARRRVLAVAGGVVATGGAMLGALLLVPQVVERSFADDLWVATAGLAAALVAAVLLVSARPRARRRRAVAAAALALFATSLFLWVAVDAARGAGVFGWGPRAYGALAGAAALFYFAADAQSWAAFRLRFARLRTALATTRENHARARGAPETAGLYPVSPAAEPEWPAVAALDGPGLVVCASASGMPVTFSGDSQGSGAYPGGLRKPVTAAAVSGAAAGPRCGLWIPNPRLPSGPHRLKRPRANYLLKEVFGMFDPDDPYVYAREPEPGAALVELIRRRCRWIFCLDGDASAASLEAARTTALADLGAEIDVDASPLTTGDAAVAVGLVRYHSCGEVGRDACETGLLFYGSAVPARGAPVGRLALSFRDGLGRDDFDNLVRLGEWVGRSLALEYERLPQALAAGHAAALEGSPALVEAYERLTGALPK